eukprot:m.79044 g.79044  ORF g.79044 m.79044 type:complete len:548 (+) comp14610_c0_seq2:186-1829(+)
MALTYVKPWLACVALLAAVAILPTAADQCTSPDSDCAEGARGLQLRLFASPVSPFLDQVLDQLAAQTVTSRVDLQIFAVDNDRNTPVLQNWVADKKSTFASLTLGLFESSVEAMTSLIAESAPQDALATAGQPVYVMHGLAFLKLNNTLEYLDSVDMGASRAVAPLLLSGDLVTTGNFMPSLPLSDDESACSDSHPFCHEWSLDGECTANPAWMRSSCALSCDQCRPDEGTLLQNTELGAKAFVDAPPANGRADVPVAYGLLKLSPAAWHAVSGDNAPSSLVSAQGAYDIGAAIARTLAASAATSGDTLMTVVANSEAFGYLIDPSGYDHEKVHPELALIDNNEYVWGVRYLNENYDNFAALATMKDCYDVYRVPLLHQRFCTHIIEEANHCGEWSGGGYHAIKDERLGGGYENVPTDDIHLNQFGLQAMWKTMLRRFLTPVTSHFYTGYQIKGLRTLDFIVRYRPGGQTFLKPHLDSSTVTINLALNQGGVDFHGGGTRFIRQNCTAKDLPSGWGALFPGALTHYHEGLPLINGTRYLLVSFIDQP